MGTLDTGVDRGQWDSGHWTLDTGHWTLDTGHWTVAVDTGVDRGQWTVDTRQWTVDSGHWTVDTGQRPSPMWKSRARLSLKVGTGTYLPTT